MSNLDSKDAQLNVHLEKIDIKPAMGKIVISETRGLYYVSVGRQVTAPEINDDQAVQLKEAAFEALLLAHEISPQSLTGLSLRCIKNNEGYYMTSAYQFSQRMLSDESNSQMAAILHELMENLEEDFGYELRSNNEAIPQIAEFLFTGNSRIAVFRRLHDEFYSGQLEDKHSAAWGEVVTAILPGASDEDPETIFANLMKARELPKDQKIQIVKKAVSLGGVRESDPLNLPPQGSASAVRHTPP